LDYFYQIRTRTLKKGLNVQENFVYSPVILYDDVGWIFQSIQVHTVFGVASIETDLILQDFTLKSMAIYQLTIGNKRQRIFIYRSYMKIQTLFANIGGVIKLIMVVFGYFTVTLGNNSFYNKLIDELYCYTGIGVNNGTNIDVSSSKINSKLENNFVLNNSNNMLNLADTSPKRQKSVSVQNLKSFMADDNVVLKESFIAFIQRSFCKKCLNKKNFKEREIYNTGINDIQKKLDIICYFKTVQRLDHIIETVYNEVQASIVKSYQKVNLARIQEFNSNFKKDAEIKEYFKQQLSKGELVDLDLKVFEILPKNKKKEILQS
jgi:hypothetical protein